MATTIPYNIQTKYKQIAYSGAIPVFTAIPLEEDFNLAVANIFHNGESEKIILDFDYCIIMISKGKDGKYYIFHEFSLEELWSAYGIASGCDWNQVTTFIKAMLAKQAEEITCYLRKINRIIKSE